MALEPLDTTPERVLVIVAHPDDAEFGVAGSVARWVKEGAQAVYAIVTNGAAGSNDPDTDVAELARTRRAEQCAAAETVGVTDVRFLDYEDGILEPSLSLRRDLTRMIREIRPDRVICQDPEVLFVGDAYVNHPDHRAAGEAAVYAVFPSAGTRPIFPELLEEGLEPHKVKELFMMLTLKPTHVVDISATFEQKVAALRCHESQVGPEVGEWIGEWNAENGRENGFDYAEVYRVMTFVRDEENPVESGD